LAGVEAELFVIIEHSVHVFDPKSIDRAVEHDPAFIRSLVLGSFIDDLGEDTIFPLLSGLLNETVELTHGN